MAVTVRSIVNVTVHVNVYTNAYVSLTLMLLKIAVSPHESRLPGVPPWCFPSFSPPKWWCQIKISCVMNSDHIGLASVVVRELSCFTKFRVFPEYQFRDHYHGVSHHFLLQNYGFKSKFRVWWTLIIFVLAICVACKLSCFTTYSVSPEYRRDRHHGVAHHFLMKNRSFKSWCCEIPQSPSIVDIQILDVTCQNICYGFGRRTTF